MVERRDERSDTRKVRRALTVGEAYRLLSVAGPRRMFYAVQLWTGLRVSEVAALEWRDLDPLDIERPAIRLRAATTKAKRADELPVHPDLVELLRDAKPRFAKPTDRVFRTAPRLRTFRGGWYKSKTKQGTKRRYMSGDLDRAGIPFTDDQGRTIDRDALRTTFVSWLGVSGVDPRAQIALARHAPTGVTLRHYQDFSLFDLWAEIAKLPPIRWDVADAEAVRATGTDEAHPHPDPVGNQTPVAPPVALRFGREGVEPSATDRNPNEGDTSRHRGKSLETKGKTASVALKWHSGRRDLNSRPPAPKAHPGTLTPAVQVCYVLTDAGLSVYDVLLVRRQSCPKLRHAAAWT